MDESADPISLSLYLDECSEDQEPSSQSSPDTYLLGFVISNIVGLQHYRGKISGREMVGLVREPFNPYDPNAIKVLNTRTLQVGHIERSVAAVLSPLIDSNLIIVEGIVPNSRSASNRFRIPCQIHIFARLEAFNSVKSAISRGGLELISQSDVSFTLSEAAVVKGNKAGGESVDKVFKLVGKNVSKKAAMGPVEPPNEVIISQLLLHQKEGLGWLLHRENSDELPPFWEEKGGEFVNVLTNYQTDKRPEPLRGGIFADDMGLGKTLTLLSLIAFDKFFSFVPNSGDAGIDEIVEEDVKKGKRGRVSRKGTGTRKKRKIEDTEFGRKAKGKSVSVADDCVSFLGQRTTLVVCPPSVFSSWITQLEEHTNPGKLKVYMYYGERTREVEELKKYDIVLTTYSTLATEESWLDSPVKKMEWWRVILDEAHVIKNANAQQSIAVTNLKATCRWVVTGTPIQNGSLDLFSLMAFLRFEPFSIKSYWRSLVQRPLAQGKKNGFSRLQVLMASISLRRTKGNDLLGLPPRTLQTCYVELSIEERELYDQIEGKAKSVIQEFINDGNLMRNYSTVLGILLRLRQICTSVALLPPDLKALFPSSNIEDVSNNPELLKKMVAMLQDGEDFDCPICISPPIDVVITCCAHIFCRSCILKTLQRTKPFCPLCRHPLSQSDLFSAPPESSDADHTQISSRNTASSKVSALLTLLQESRDQNPATKSVVFSQFRTMLLLLEKPLTAAGFKIVRLDGSMNAKRRAQVIEEFQVPGPDGPTVLLASLKASGAGINLTAASRVYLLEPWWNPAVEEQAMDRVHRIGQKEDVKIVRLIARNSIEERVLELQERKKKLAMEAFGRKGTKNRKEVTIDDLRTLMSL
ncbi:putative SWI/SNF-related matrix-associated actin-dependent regulator of chromatin subfamily A member 3-like 1 [Durio zibethinus]|uniref:SWI/SNF-related matrix-associated actin-dependent regulator of chromatin subfamily A member 3-like 1 n=1 Tax=Durio zibethinus TaxID=66656 RepID=A0A6P5YT36_DURZI|nr:putative SWI/SNF-related matrix-associated actin-dependent regulator of chromatin subfamily A member 3-like 1 [Durio zibethinus]